MSEKNDKRGGRLPPPAFPPGGRRPATRKSGSGSPPPASGVPLDPFISPDDPLPAREDRVGSAFIQPDDPIPERQPDAVTGAFISPEDPIPKRARAVAPPTVDEHEEGVVTGIGFDPHLHRGELAAAGDPHVLELIDSVGKLAQALRRKGEAGLRTSPEMGRFDATLRAYCLGYLAGRRAEAEPEFLHWGEVSKEDA